MVSKFMKLVVSGVVSFSLILSGVGTAGAQVVSNEKAVKAVSNQSYSDDEENNETGQDYENEEVSINSEYQDYRKSEFKLVVSFDKELKRTSVNTRNIHLRNLNIADDVTGDSAIKVKLDSNKKDIVITLKEDLDYDTVYNLILSGIRDAKGNVLEESEFEIITIDREEEVYPDEIKEVSKIKGEAISPTSIKWTWEYDKAEEKYIDGFVLYDDEGNLLTEFGEINVKQREYIQKGLLPGKKYTIEIAAFRAIDGNNDDTIESDKKSASVRTKDLGAINISEKDFTGKAQGNDIMWYWETKNYQDIKDNYSDYVVRISKDATFKTYKEVPFIKGKYLEKGALDQKGSKNKIQITRYYQVVNKAYDIKGDIQKKVVVFNPSVKIKAPRIVVGEVNSESGYAILKIRDLSNNEAAFNVYAYDEYQQRYFLGTINSNSKKTTGENYAFKAIYMYGLDYAGFTATAVDENGNESDESAIAHVVMD